MTPEERFWRRVRKTDTCWLWVGRLDRDGYAGQVEVNGKRWIPHRLAYTWTNGPIAKGLEIDHLCHVRHCVRPDHLQAIPHALNQQNQTGRRKNSKTGIRGVAWSRRQERWVVHARGMGQRHYGGQFVNIEDAERAAIALRNRLMTNNLDDRRRDLGERSLDATG